ncbi:MAG: RNA polymerase sigma factor [Candidatus Heimdallarchaeaceae archaeon]
MTEKITDDDIVKALLSNECWAIKIISDRITPIIKYKLFQVQDWEDARQQSLMEIVIAVKRLKKINNLWGLVKKIVYSTIVDFNRLHKRHSQRNCKPSRNGSDKEDWTNYFPDPKDDQSSYYERKDLLIYVFQKLDKECRELIKVVFLEDIKYSEIASRLGISEGTLRVRIHRCKEKAMRLRDEYFGK